MDPVVANVVVVAHWNKAILTPEGIMKHVFKTEPGTTIGILFPMNGGPQLIEHEGFHVSLSGSRLQLQLVSDRSLTKLVSGMSYARNAVEGLPLTPLIAGGFNLHYEIDPSQELSDLLFERSFFDELDFSTVNRTVERKLRYGQGEINVKLEGSDEDTVRVSINFNKSSSSQSDLVEWLSLREEEIVQATEKILGYCTTAVLATGEQTA